MENYLGVIVAALVASGAFGLYIIRGEIAKANKDRQPRNGGSGWGDVARQVNLIAERQSEIADDMRYVRTRLDEHIVWHLDQ